MPRSIPAFIALIFTLLLASCSSPDAQAPDEASKPSGCWEEVLTPDLGEGAVILNGVHAFGERDVWAVGQRALPGGARAVTVVLRGDGSKWSAMPSPNGPDGPNAKSHLYSVGGTSSEDVWAVGAYAQDGAHYRGLAMHWDGREWRAYDTPNRGALDNTINGVSASAPDDAWLVGSYLASEHDEAHMMAARWDGARWTQADLEHVETHNLLAVTAPRRGLAWAVGTEVLRWDGMRWGVEPIPAEVSGTYFDGVATTQDGGMAWAVGNDGNEAVALFWNGARWSGGPLPKLADGPYPHDVAALSPTEVWAVGEYSESPLDRQLLLLRWDGAGWHTVANPLPGKNTRLLSVARAGSGLWAVGAQGVDEESKGLVMQYGVGECDRSK